MQQARLGAAAPALAPALMALNSSAIYLGQAAGASSGGWLIAHHGYGPLSFVGARLARGGDRAQRLGQPARAGRRHDRAGRRVGERAATARGAPGRRRRATSSSPSTASRCRASAASSRSRSASSSSARAGSRARSSSRCSRSSQVLPGPNVVNLALMLGDRFFGLKGALAAVAGMLAVPLVIVLVLTAAYAEFSRLRGRLGRAARHGRGRRRADHRHRHQADDDARQQPPRPAARRRLRRPHLRRRSSGCAGR